MIYIVDSNYSVSGYTLIGYRVWSNGFIENFGQAATVNGRVEVTLTKPYTKCYQVQITDRDDIESSNTRSHKYTIISLSKFVIISEATTGNDAVVYYAIGI